MVDRFYWHSCLLGHDRNRRYANGIAFLCISMSYNNIYFKTSTREILLEGILTNERASNRYYSIFIISILNITSIARVSSVMVMLYLIFFGDKEAFHYLMALVEFVKCFHKYAWYYMLKYYIINNTMNVKHYK